MKKFLCLIGWHASRVRQRRIPTFAGGWVDVVSIDCTRCPHTDHIATYPAIATEEPK